MPISPSFSYTLNGHPYTNLTFDADFGASLAGTANDLATIIGAVASDLANFNWGGLSGGTADAVTLTPSPALGAVVDGTRYVFIPAVDVNAGGTLNISTTGAMALVRPNGDPIEQGDIVSPEPAFVIAYGSTWIVTNWIPTAVKAFDPNSAITQTETNGSGVTLSAAKIVEKVIFRTGPTSDFTDAFDSAANIVAAASEPFVNGYFPLMLINGSAVKWSIVGGTNIAYATPNDGAIVIPSGSHRIIWVMFTNVSGGTEAIQVAGGSDTTGGDQAILGNLNVQGNIVTAGYFVIGGTLSSSGDAGFSGNLSVAGATALSGNFSVGGTITLSNAYIALTGLPTSAAGLGAGQLWNNSGVVNIV